MSNNKDWFASRNRKYWGSFVEAGALDVERCLAEGLNHRQLPELAVWLGMEEPEVARLQSLSDDEEARLKAEEEAAALGAPPVVEAAPAVQTVTAPLTPVEDEDDEAIRG